MIPIKINFRNSGGRRDNDIVYDSPVFDLHSAVYIFKIIPNSAFWRFGIRFSHTTTIDFIDGKDLTIDRHHNKDVVDLVVAAGKLREDTSFDKIDEIELTQYHLPDNYNHVLDKTVSRSTRSEIKLILSYDNQNAVLCITFIVDKFKSEIKIPDFFYPYLKISAWADYNAFDLDCIIEVDPIKIDYDPVLLLIQGNKRTKSNSLDLSNCGIKEIPDQLTELVWLEELVIGTEEYWDFENNRKVISDNKGSQNTFSKLPAGLSKLKNIRRLIISGAHDIRQRVTDLSEIRGLFNLEYLFIEHLSIKDISFLSSDFSKLEYLSLYDNEISDITPLMHLTNLRVLVLSENPVMDIETLANLTNLEYLSFRNTSVINISPIANLFKLRRLFISTTNINDISSLSGLTHLDRLFFADTWVSEIDSLVNLERLTTIGFSNCMVKNIRPLIKLKSLRQFDCKGNPIEDCPSDIYESGDATQLRAYFNAKYFEQVPEEKVKNTSNKLSRIRKSVKNDPDTRKDVKLIILGNSNGGKTNLVNYLETGKFNGERNTTHGLEVHRWIPDATRFPSLKDVAVSIWDFGGQEYYHGAYRLFLSNNALYLLLWCKETNVNGQTKATLRDGESEVLLENFELRYWLDTIRYYASGEENLNTTENTSGNPADVTGMGKKIIKARLIATQNKVDDPEDGKERIPQEVHMKYGIADSFHVSLLKGSDKKNLRQFKTLEFFMAELEDAIKSSADMNSIPAKWQQIRNEILALRKSTIKQNAFLPFIDQNPWIRIDQFRKACDSFLPDPLSDDELYTLPRWLDKGGTVVYFPDIPNLGDKIFLKPDELAKRIYEVLNEKVRANKGEFSADDLFKGDSGIKTVFLELAQQLELIFPHPLKKKGNNFLAPQYLPDEHAIEDLYRIAANGAWQSDLWIRVPLFHYKKILHGALLYYASDPKTECRYFWKHGIMFVKNGIRVLIKGLYPLEKEFEGVILIGVEKNAYMHQELQREIFTKFREIMMRKGILGIDIHAPEISETNKQAETPVTPILGTALPCDMDIMVSYDGQNYINYKTLRENSTEPKIRLGNNSTIVTYNFAAILPSVPQKAKKVFLSYSHQNTAWLGRLRTHLAGLRRAKQIETWDDKELLPGELWDQAIKNSIETADVFILMLSADFIASDYIWNEELPKAIDKFKTRNATVIPILFEPLDLGGLSSITESSNGQSYKISDFEIIPKDAKGHLQAVSLWASQEEALTEVTKRIREAILK